MTKLTIMVLVANQDCRAGEVTHICMIVIGVMFMFMFVFYVFMFFMFMLC